MKKVDIRKQYIEKRNSLSNDEVQSKSLSIAELFFKKINLDSCKIIHVFIPIPKLKEVYTLFIINELHSNFSHIKTATSITSKTGLEHVIFNSNTKFIADSWGIPTPQNGEKINEKEIDIVLVPLLAFDKNLQRVGYGKGYYDKFLSQCKTDVKKIGLSFFPPLDEDISDISALDVKLDLVIYPKKIKEI